MPYKHHKTHYRTKNIKKDIMKNIATLTILGLLSIFGSCNKDDSEAGGDLMSKDEYSSEPGSNNGSQGQYGPNNGDQGQYGLITAGEWNDLSNWDFWGNLLNEQEYSSMPEYWGFHTKKRMSVAVRDNGIPQVNAKVELLRNETVIWTARTDNFGYAELWVGLFQEDKSIDLSTLSLKVNDELQDQEPVLIEDGINEIEINSNIGDIKKVELSFIVDATGSMGDEIDFLKADLKSVIDSVKRDDSNLDIYTSTVFYRDEGDDYVTRKSEFTSDLNNTIDFINRQDANGGDDFPEAVHTALNTGINELQWSNTARTRIAFLLLDAPPHYTAKIVENIHGSIKDAARKGIKIIPVTASGIDRETEFLMRFMAISTNATYVFITNDSGIGGGHLKPSVGQYEVEHLNDLMVRLIKKYSE